MTQPPDTIEAALAEHLDRESDEYDLEFAIFLEGYEDAFWAAGLARKALAEIDAALYSLKLQRKALQAEVNVKEHGFTDFILAHQDDMPRLHAYRALKRVRTVEPAPEARPSGAAGEASRP